VACPCTSTSCLPSSPAGTHDNQTAVGWWKKGAQVRLAAAVHPLHLPQQASSLLHPSAACRCAASWHAPAVQCGTSQFPSSQVAGPVRVPFVHLQVEEKALIRRYTPYPAYYGFVYPVAQRDRETRVICRIHPRRFTLDAIHR